MFKLTITFAGLCLLVRDEARNMLHVLMPPATGHIPHIPTLVYKDDQGELHCQEISGMHLEFPGIGSDDFSPEVGREVLDFRDDLFGGRTVAADLLGTGVPPANAVNARMRLTAGRYSHARRGGGFWKFKVGNGHLSRPVPTAVDWVIRRVNLPHLEIKNMAGVELFKVFPDAKDEIHILVVNVMQKELDAIDDLDIPLHSECPGEGKPASHLQVYEKLLTPPDELLPPLFDAKSSTDAGICPPPNGRSQRDGSARDAATRTAGSPPDDLTGHAQPGHTGHGTAGAAAAAAGTELTCMVATAPAG